VEGLEEIIHEFLVESHENLDQLDRDLVELEQDTGSRELISRIFRTIHTIKGTSGFLAFGRLEKLTHAGESLLSRLRDGAQPVTPETISLLLSLVDVVRALLARIEQTNEEGDVDTEGLAGQLAAAAAAVAPNPPPVPTSVPTASEPTPAEAAPEATPVPVPVGDAPDRARDASIRAEMERRRIGELLVEHGEVSEADVRWALERQLDGDERKIGTILLEEGKTGQTAVNEALQTQGRRNVADRAIRVDVDLLDNLMNLVGELVLVRNQLVRVATENDNPVVVRTTQRLNLITSELQEGIMKTRLQPIDHLFAKLPRVIRDLSTACGKRVRMAMEGRDTELDRSLLEAIKDPLTHLVRNAVDHGIESPGRRGTVGKDPEGTLTLRAFHESGRVVIEVTDDGGGIDVDRVARTAVDRGLVRPEDLAQMEPRDVMMLVFQPGFSTAAEVTNVSGRGVGMDVVKTNIERIGGTVDVASTLGVGTTWRLTIPLTLAIIQAVTVECHDERYVIPQLSVQELFFVDGQNARIEYAANAPVFRLRGRLLPLVRLDHSLGRPAGGDAGVYVAVLQADGRRFGLVVDRVLNTEEVVVKALSPRVKEAGVYAGATILGDGKVGLILDVPALARRSHLAATSTPDSDAGLDQAGADGALDRLLVTGVGARRIAIPLDAVTRLEEFATDRVERSGSREVVQYRGEIMPLLRLGDLLGIAPGEPRDVLPVVVYTEGGRSVALAVDSIVDIVDERLPSSDADSVGIVGTAVIRQRVTDLLDVRQAILAADPHFYRDQPALVDAYQ
jgi:two-component system, chemotaxis family, sensor kinase CheA